MRSAGRSTSWTPGTIAEWTAEHDGYVSLNPPARHRRTVRLDRASRSVDIVDEIDGDVTTSGWPFTSAPMCRRNWTGTSAVLPGPTAATPGAARLELPGGLAWSLHRGETDPILGWYSSGLGRRVPAVALLGRGRSSPGQPLATRLEFLDANIHEKSAFTWAAVSWGTSDTPIQKASEIQAEAG